ncbi:SPIR1 protein, partial [Nothoprocta pentlandii]|nr:SPIR1 protein [Nothoprocta pentlandii]
RVSLAELLRCLERPLGEEQAWALCFQGCRTMGRLARGPPPALHAVLIKGLGSVFLHADGDASFKVHQKSAGSCGDRGCGFLGLSPQLLEYLGVVVYEALDWGIDSQAERELSEPLEKLLSLMLKLDNEAVKRVVTLQDVIKICEDRLPRPSEAASHYKGTCRSLFAEYIELQKLLSVIQTSKEVSQHHPLALFIPPPSEGGNTAPCDLALLSQAALWPAVVRELQSGVRLRAAPPRRPAPRQQRARSPYEALADDIRHRRYTLRKVSATLKPPALAAS